MALAIGLSECAWLCCLPLTAQMPTTQSSPAAFPHVTAPQRRHRASGLRVQFRFTEWFCRSIKMPLLRQLQSRNLGTTKSEDLRRPFAATGFHASLAAFTAARRSTTKRSYSRSRDSFVRLPKQRGRMNRRHDFWRELRR